MRYVCTLVMAAYLTGLAAGFKTLTACPADSLKPTYRWLMAGTRMYVEGGGCVTLPEIFAGAPNPPIVPYSADGLEDTVDTGTGIWLLTHTLYIESGVTLLLHDDQGCKELRLANNGKNVIQLRAHGAYLSLLRTKVVGWVRTTGTYDLGANTGKSPRGFISVISEVVDATDSCVGKADDNGGEGKMDIINSEVAYLGYQASEAYGISYKVRGFCLDESNPEVFDKVQVWGNIRFSNIHHNWFGLYTYGHQDGLWEYNDVHDNGYYGFDPHDDSDNLRIHNNNVYNNGWHSIIASKRCNDVSIQNNVVSDGKAHGIMLHRSIDSAIVRNNTVVRHADACITVFESFEGEVSSNTCIGNNQGIRLSMGSSRMKIFDNTIKDTVGYGIWLFIGSDPLEASIATKGRPTNNLFAYNFFDTADHGIYALNSDETRYIGNTFVGTDDNYFNGNDEILWKDNVVYSDFDMDMESSCLSAGSDFAQVSAAGGTEKVCS